MMCKVHRLFAVWLFALNTLNSNLTKDVKVYREYRKITNKVRKCTRDINRNEQCEIAKNAKDNPKKIWNYVNGKRKCKDRIGNLDYINPD